MGGSLMNVLPTENKAHIVARQIMGKAVGLLKPGEMARLTKIVNQNKWDRFHLAWRRRIYTEGERPYAAFLSVLSEFEREDD